MRTLLLGATGLLGQAMERALRRRGWPVVAAARSGAPLALDISDLGALEGVLAAEAPDLVVNCAALVDIPLCEAEPALAWAVNARPLATLADWTGRSRGRLLHVSTDHYFPEGGPEPHDEAAQPRFLNEYARSKFAGEAFALSAPDALVLRTSIVGIRGRDRPTFAEWAIRAVEENQPVALFADAYTSSIDTDTFARAALDLLDGGARGLFNCAASEVYSKEAFVRAVAARMGRPLDRATAGSAASLVPPRPASLGLDVRRAEAILGYELPGLAQVVEAVLDQHRKRASA